MTGDYTPQFATQSFSVQLTAGCYASVPGLVQPKVSSQQSAISVKVVRSQRLKPGNVVGTDSETAVLAFASACTENKDLLTFQVLPLSEVSLCRQQAFVALCASCCCF